MRLSTLLRVVVAAGCFGLLYGCAATTQSVSIPEGMHEVQPLLPNSTGTAAPASPGRGPSREQSSAELTIGRGKFFSFALPQGWKPGEDGQFALTLVAPDNKAFTVMVGNAGLPPNYPPGRFVQEKLGALRPQNLRVGQGRPASAVKGFSQAYQFDVTYTVGGVTWQGLVKCHIAPAYDTQTMAMTAALSDASQWPGYSTWLPLVSDQISATDGGAFGMRGIMAQNLQNSTAYAEAARQYRDWSAKNWQGVVDARGASQDKNNTGFREAIGGVQTYANPYDSGAPVELPTTFTHYWVNAQGTYAGTDDPSFNPNVGSTENWKPMPVRKP
ncbi:MAG: hypothetical protein ABI824_18300 [Acidobacteriota bacterium]